MSYKLSLIIDNTSESIAGAISKYTQSEYTPDFEILKSGTFLVEDISQLIIGIVLVLLYTFIGVILALDIAYLTLPWFQEHVKKHRWDKVTPRNRCIISKDASDALIEANTLQTGTSSLFIYIKKKLGTLIILVIVSILIGSNYTVIKDILTMIISQFLSAFS